MLATRELTYEPYHRTEEDVMREEEHAAERQPAALNRAHGARQRRLARDLTAAVEQDAFVLHYQPRLALGRGNWTGAEALIRWPHRRRGLIQPDEFLPLAERAGQMPQIGAWVLRNACLQAQSWGIATVSVNVSMRQLVEGMLLNQVAEALDLSGLDPECLEIELAETTLTDIGMDTLLTLSAIRDIGVRIVLDDFGTGFASLGMLKRLPLTAMKLDKSLIRDIPFDREDSAIVRAMIATGHALGLTVIAEGIETESQRAFLSASDCDEGQGFLFSAALPAAELRARFVPEPRNTAAVA